MAQSNTVVNSGIGFWPLLGLTFVVLKLCDVVSWSWWWVLAPFWGPLALAIVIGMTVAICIGVSQALGEK